MCPKITWDAPGVLCCVLSAPRIRALPANTRHEIAAARTHGSALPDFCLFGFQSTTQVCAVMGEQGRPGTGPHHSPGHWERHRNEFTRILLLSPTSLTIRSVFSEKSPLSAFTSRYLLLHPLESRRWGVICRGDTL